ncbi:hypothetical protein [Niabella ginsengisoli]|uniref:DUF4394 domain-containing protein n=1 Tax=Niabella ginsengisoli TaxID=522298 RepID=A0ABS9SI73_9BACT|nr:hypothetical protein [Niabella ginsengisoli]MCH5598068.1 hypothetical protein [Niabella ginsengisoli]
MNGIGLNRADKLLYGAGYKDPGTPNVITDDVSLYKIGADGNYVNLGILPVTGQGAAIPGGGGIAEFVNASAGTVTADGSYVYMTIGLKQSGVNKVASSQILGTPLNLTSDDVRTFVVKLSNVAALPATPGVTIAPAITYYELISSDPKIITGMNGFLMDVNQNYPNFNYSNGGIQDIDIDPVSGQLYAYFNYQDPSPTPGQSVDVVGFPVVASMPSGGTATLTSIGNTINQTPDQELAGVGFDQTGKLYALFNSGEYGQLNLTSGSVDNLATSNIPTSVYLSQNHLRGDFASAIPDPTSLPVTFGSIEARLSNDQLFVTWSTDNETNNDHFKVEVATDGKNFREIGTVISKATNGNNDTTLQYSFTGNLESGILGMSMLGFGIFMIGFNRKQRIIASLIMIAGFIITISSCTKSDAGIGDQNETLFVRIVQVDKDGGSTTSKVVKAIKQ